MTQDPIRFAIIGAGGIAQAYAQAFARSERASLTAVVDIDVAAAHHLGSPVGAAIYGSIDELLIAADRIDAVIVSTPPVTHPEIAVRLLEAGIHVLCEKPLAIDFDGAMAMARAALQSDAILTMASKFRCVEDVDKAREIVRRGDIGDLVLYENAFTCFVDMTDRWNSKKTVSGGGVLIDNGTHSLDLARYFLGPIEELQVIEGLRLQGLDVEETVAIYLKSRAGAMGNIDLSWTINKGLPWYINLHGSAGSIALGWKESKWKPADGDWEVFGSGYDKVAAFLYQIDNFAGAIRGEESLLVSIEDGLASVLAVEAAYRSMNTRPWISVDSCRTNGGEVERSLPGAVEVAG